MKSIFFRYFLLLCLTFSFCIAQPGYHKDGSLSEPSMKALFIYNFTKHIEWPQNKMQQEKFLVCVYGHSDITQQIQSILKGKKIFDKQVEVTETTDFTKLNGCFILFIPEGEEKILNKKNMAQTEKGILYVTEENAYSGKMSCINLSREEDKIGFELHESSLLREGLKVSNQLQQLSASYRN